MGIQPRHFTIVKSRSYISPYLTNDMKNNDSKAAGPITSQEPRPDPRRWKALGLLSLAQFLVILDTSIIGVALPTIQQHFGFSQTAVAVIRLGMRTRTKKTIAKN